MGEVGRRWEREVVTSQPFGVSELFVHGDPLRCGANCARPAGSWLLALLTKCQISDTPSATGRDGDTHTSPPQGDEGVGRRDASPSS